MPEHKPFLPPHIGKWLASDKPAQREKAEAALRAAEPDANDFLLEREKKEREHYNIVGIIAFLSFQMVWTIVQQLHKHFFPPPHGIVGDVLYTLVSILIAVPLGVAWIWLLIRTFVLPVGARYAATVLKLAQRGDVRVVPLLLSSWLEPSPISSDRLPELEDALIKLTKNAAPGSIPLSDKAKDPAVNLRGKVARMTRKQNGAVFFAPSATVNPRRIQVWLALLPHLAADPNPKSQMVLAGLLDAPAKTLEEELLQNTVRALIAPNVKDHSVDDAATETQFSAWKPAETGNVPTLLQRRR